jgi:hypothetical protein
VKKVIFRFLSIFSGKSGFLIDWSLYSWNKILFLPLFPWVRIFPTKGRTFPARGRTFPTRGRTFPTRGRTFPTRGRTFPASGRTFPTRGRTFPIWGYLSYRERTFPTNGGHFLKGGGLFLPGGGHLLPGDDISYHLGTFPARGGCICLYSPKLHILTDNFQV